DILLIREDRWPQIQSTGDVAILTSSPRRAYNLDSFLRVALPAKVRTLNFVNVRGNVPTRIRKLFQSDVDGLIVAKAAIDRLLEAEQTEFAITQAEVRKALTRSRWMVLPLSANPSAPAQGALAVEILRDRNDLKALLEPINSRETFEVVMRERAILAGYGGGCHQKIGVAVLRRPFGDVTFLRGLTDDAVDLESATLTSLRPTSESVRREDLWPQNASEGRLFISESVPAKQPAASRALWVAKADALPDDWAIELRQIVWTSGLQTWKRLAARGVWVNGSAESLGENESPGIETLIGGKLEWLKLTHAQGFAGDLPTLATYRLTPRNGAVDLSGKKHFFWKSGSSFE